LLDLAAYGFERWKPGITLHDPLAVAVADDPSLVGWTPLHVAVETESPLTRGLSLADRREGAYDRAPANCRVALTVDAPRALARRLGGLWRGPADGRCQGGSGAAAESRGDGVGRHAAEESRRQGGEPGGDRAAAGRPGA